MHLNACMHLNECMHLNACIVQLKVKGKRLSGGCFKPKDSTPEEVECARLAAVESRSKLEEKYSTNKQSWAPLHLA